MATLDDLRRIAVELPGSEERATTGGAAWFVRRKLYAWECHPWPSIPADMREIIAAEPVVGVKVADPVDALALVQMAPDVFLRTTTSWGEPKVAFRMAGIDRDHLAELVTEAWRVQAPRYLRAEFDGGGDAGASPPPNGLSDRRDGS
ncbi:MmcQ/YjbR family DNA-binding protein [Agromyces sp. GXQ0307]|uniref:MmcQ/YjbR family DNA-binding protein n=1 Tax=Agromyces sp. GXQ0307 TaxID=3377835 RepID=UPI00383A3CCC